MRRAPLRFLRDGLHLCLQPLVLGDEARLFALELVKQALGTVPGLERLFALVQRLDQRLGLHVEDARRDQDAFDVGENARMLEKTLVGDRGDDRLFVFVGHLRHISFRREEPVEERIDGREVDPGGPHDEPQFVGGALLALLDGFEDPFFHLGRRGAGEGGGDDEFRIPFDMAADLLGQTEGLPRTGRGGDEEALHHGRPPVR